MKHCPPTIRKKLTVVAIPVDLYGRVVLCEMGFGFQDKAFVQVFDKQTSSGKAPHTTYQEQRVPSLASQKMLTRLAQPTNQQPF